MSGGRHIYLIKHSFPPYCTFLTAVTTMGWPWMVSCSAVLFLKEDRDSGEQVADGLPLLLPSVPHPLFPNGSRVPMGTFLGIWVPFLCFGSPFFYFRPKNSDKYGYLLSANADDWSWKIHKLFWEKSSDASSLHEWSVDIICLQMQTAGFDKCTTTQQTNLYIDSAQICTDKSLRAFTVTCVCWNVLSSR